MDLVFLYDKRFIRPELIETFKDFLITTKPVIRCNVLLRWGNLDGEDENARLVLNRKQPLKICFDTEKLFEILKLNKVRRPRCVIPNPDSRYPLIGKSYSLTANLGKEEIVTDFSEAQKSGADFFIECINTVKKYNVYLFDYNVFLITKKVSVKTNTAKQGARLWDYEEIPCELDQDTQKICQLAKRAIYLLRLDFGMVHAGIDVQGRPVVLDVSPVPVFPRRALHLFREQVINYLNSQIMPKPQLLTPPHPLQPKSPSSIQTSLFMENSNTTLASPINSATVKNQPVSNESNVLLGADPEFILRDTTTGQIIYPSDYLNQDGSLGYDERSERREGRLFPLAEIRPEPDVCPLRLTEKIREILARAISLFPPHIEWLAGSLHFENYQIGGHIHFSNLNINSRLLKALDNYLAIPIMLVEDPVASSRRRKQYGWLGSVRPKPHGGFEYRTPASWLISPELTRGCLCLAKIVATEYAALPRDYFTDIELQKAFYQSKKHYFYDIFKGLWDDLIKTSLYSKYAQYFVPLTDLIYSCSHWNEETDLRKSWGLLASF